VGAVARVAPLLLLAVLPAACSDTVDVDAGSPHGGTARACRALVDALPDRVDDLDRRPVDDGDRYAAAWGDPAVTLACGVGRPRGFTATSQCQNANGVDWYIPDEQLTGKPTDLTITAVGRSAYVRVELPKEYWPPANALVDLAPALKKLRSVRPCL